MKLYNVTFILKDTQAATITLAIEGESVSSIADDIQEQLSNNGFFELFSDDTYGSVDANFIAAFRILPIAAKSAKLSDWMERDFNPPT